jgi:hypothetical protein
MLRPMILLALSVAILDDHTQLTRLETVAVPLLCTTAIGTAGIDNLVHPVLLRVSTYSAESTGRETTDRHIIFVYKISYSV